VSAATPATSPSLDRATEGAPRASLDDAALLATFSAPVSRWFTTAFGAPTEPQRHGWPAIAGGEDTLIAAPTGTGKTLAAFLAVLDRLVRRALAGTPDTELRVLYVSPLRALSHDIEANLERPLAGIRDAARELGLALPEIRTAVRTGDTPSSERQSMLRRPPQILVTTPESLYLLLTAERSRALLASVETVIVDEIHALARDKRGSHLALSLERLVAACRTRPVRIGLSATQRPLAVFARFLTGVSPAVPLDADLAPAPVERPVRILDLGHRRALDLRIAVPPDEDLAAVTSAEQWEQIVALLCAEIRAHRTTLVFVNTRRLAERLAHRLAHALGTDAVAAHHGSLSRERRLRVEADLRDGRLRALVATASLELGIDIGSVDLVCQFGSARGIATLLQRVGRSGHALGRTPKGRLYPTTRDELVECAATVRAVQSGRLDAVCPPVAPLDILAQQIVAECACRDWREEDLLALVRRAAPYASLAQETFHAVLEMLVTGFETPRGRRAAYLHRDRLAGVVRGRRGARLAAIRSGGAIPDTGDYRVVLHPSGTQVGTVGEDFAVEAMQGDVFVLGTHSWRVHKVETDVVRVSDAEGAPATIPFWIGEAPARTDELSREVSALRADVASALGASAAPPAWLADACGLCAVGAQQLTDYVRVQVESIGRVPTCEDIVAERFFDEAGGMQLVLHCPYGARVNRVLTLSLRKRLCKSFNQELQAAATDDAAVLSLGAPQTFPLEELPGFLRSTSLGEVLEQAVLATPLFAVRWRWNATRALSVLRHRAQGRVPFHLQRMQSDDLLTAAFPDQTACQENLTYPIEIPDHPLVRQTLYDCCHEACDLDGARRLLEAVEAGRVGFHVIDTVEPSPFAHEILNARPYAFLDDAPLEERRTRAVSLRRVLPESARDLGRLDPDAIARVRAEVRPDVRSADELCELLADLLLLDESRLPALASHAAALIAQGRATRVTLGHQQVRLCAAECFPAVLTIHPRAAAQPQLTLPAHVLAAARAAGVLDPERALDRAVRGHLGIAGPESAASLAAVLCVAEGDTLAALIRAEGAGVALRGDFDPALGGEQFCDRALLARIHRYTIATLRRSIEPVSAGDFGRFLLGWQHLTPDTQVRGEGGLLEVIGQLAGFEAPAAAWESEILARRVAGYRPELLDALCLSGAVAWGRLCPGVLETGSQSSRATPISLFPRAELDALVHASAAERASQAAAELSGAASRVLALLESRGALFARELASAPGMLPSQVEAGLRELVARGLVTCDGFAPLRRLLAVKVKRRGGRAHPVRRGGLVGHVPEGRWSRLVTHGEPPDMERRAELTAMRLLRRYGVVLRDLVAREWLPEPWREIHRALRRLEMRGEVRGGRFVSGFGGEQFALPGTVSALRRERDRAAPPAGARPALHERQVVRMSASDPLNLAGILSPGPRVPSGRTRWLTYVDGVPLPEPA
jgi:ATP-dependent Lhr-like helicase